MAAPQVATPLTKKFTGLYTYANRYAAPEGSLVTATNVLITRDGVIQPRWGYTTQVSDTRTGTVRDYNRKVENYKDYFVFIGRSSGDTTDIISTMAAASTSAPTAHYSSITVPEDPAVDYTSANFVYDFEFLLSNGNLYVNNNTGLLRIDDPTGTVASNTTGIAGSVPCAIALQPRPFSCTWARSGTTVTVTAPCAHGYVVGVYVQVTVSSATTPLPLGSYQVVTVPSATTYTLTGVNSGAASGTATIGAAQFYGSNGPVTTNDSVAYAVYIVQYDANNNELEGAPSGYAFLQNASPFLGTGANKNVQLAVLFPANRPRPNSKVLVFRSPISAVSDTGALIPPSLELTLVQERFISTTELAAGIMWVQDITPDAVGRGGRALYTNGTTDSYSQSNQQPPVGKTMAVFKDRIALGNINERARIEEHLLSTDSTNGLIAGSTISFHKMAQEGNNHIDFTAATTIDSGTKFYLYTGGTPSTDVRNTVNSLIDTINWGSNIASTSLSPLNAVIAYSSDNATDFPGRFVVELISQDCYEPDSTVYTTRFALGNYAVGRNAWAPKPSCYCAVTGGSRGGGSTVTLTLSNGDVRPDVGENVTLYTDATLGTIAQIASTNVTGVVTSVSGTTLTLTNAGSNDSLAAGTYYLISVYRPTANTSRAKNKVWLSRYKQPEAFAPYDWVKVGSPTKRVLKMVECYDTLLVFKEDGLYRVNNIGSNEAPAYSAELIDTTAILVAKDSVVKWGDRAIAWLQKGVAVLGSNGVERYISEPVKDYLRPYDLLTHPNMGRAYGVLNALEDLYELRIPGADVSVTSALPAFSATNLTYSLTHDFWTTDDLSAIASNIYQGRRYMLLKSPSSGVYPFIKQNGDGAFYNGTTTTTATVASSGSGYYALTAMTPFSAASDFIGAYATASPSGATGWFTAGSSASAGTFFASSGTPTSADTFTVYKPMNCVMKWAPVTFNAENKVKQFQESEFLFGLAEMPLVQLAYTSEQLNLSSSLTGSTLTFNGRSAPTAATNVTTVTPGNLRVHIPQNLRRCTELNVQLTIPTGGGTWALWGFGIVGSTQTWRFGR